ncbi:hypothetical protein TNCV_2185881 [Trichonephila clavipes]|nr:hypothetical protein TNCV_2185881 [Trichonephila clavipes]
MQRGCALRIADRGHLTSFSVEYKTGSWTAAELNQVVFSNESRFNLSNDDNRVRVWRPRGGSINPALALQRHNDPTAGVMYGVPLPKTHGHF